MSSLFNYQLKLVERDMEAISASIEIICLVGKEGHRLLDIRY